MACLTPVAEQILGACRTSPATPPTTPFAPCRTTVELIVQKTRALCLAVIGAFAARVNCQAQAQHRDTVSRVIVGRTETAQVAIDFENSPVFPGGDFQPSGNPDSTLGGSAIFLTTTLPIRIGSSLIPAGRFRLWLAGSDDAATLIVTRTSESGVPYAAADEVGRVPLTVSRAAGRNPGLQIVFKSERHGADTLGVSTRRSRGVEIEKLEIYPATTTTLLIAVGHLVMSVGVAAR